MRDRIPLEPNAPGRLGRLAASGLALALAALLPAACGKKTEAPGAAPAPAGAAAESGPSTPEPTPTPDTLEPPSFRSAAARDEEPFSAVKEPFEAALDDQGRIWVLDSANSRLRLLDGNGRLLGGWGGRGDGKSSFRNPEGVALSGKNLYVADTWNHRVARYSLGGEQTASVTGFMGPRGVAVAPDGSVWVTDTGNNRVLKYDAALKNPETVGPPGKDKGQFQAPVGIAIGPSGAVYVSDAGNGRIQVFKDGKFVSSWSLPWLAKSWQAHLAVDANGTCYITNPGGSEVLALDSSGKQIQRWGTDDAGEKFLRPVGLALDHRQNVLYVMDTASHKLLKISLSAKKPG